jgi:multiple sugar transport system ATP-binding protein
VRAEHVRLLPASADAPVIGKVELIEPVGSDTYVELRVGPSLVTARVIPERAPGLGEEVGMAFVETEVHLFDLTSGGRLLSSHPDRVEDGQKPQVPIA